MSLSELRHAMREFASRFDAALVSARDAERVVDDVVDDAAAIEKMAATVKSMAAARVADAGLWKERGDRSAAHDLARRTGSSVGQAKDALETARRLEAAATTGPPAAA